ncbi:MAG: efflux RND transporter periplasmic adaptor subunit [Bacteroidota bacterium]
MSKTHLSLLPLLLLLWNCKEEVASVKPSLGSVTEAVYAAASVQPDEMYTVFPATAGVIEAKYVAQGDSVEAGALLFSIKSTASELNVQNAKLNYELLDANYQGQSNVLRELEKQLEIAYLKLANDSSLYAKQKRLWEQGIGAENEVQNRKLAYEVAQREIKSLQNQYQRTKTELGNQLKISRNQIQQASSNKGDFYINSQMDGTAFEVYKEVGETVTPQQALALIGSQNDFIIELSVDEEDIAKISLGQKVLIRLEAYQGQTFEARVSKISPKMDSRTQTFLVESTFVDLPKRLYMGLSGEANIIIAEKKNALLLSKAYLIDGNKVLTEDGEVVVSIGLQSLDQVEILSPIDTSTVILQPE